MRSLATTVLVARWKEQFGIDIGNEFRGYDTISVYRCPDTGLEFFSPAEVEGSAVLYERLAAMPGYYTPNKWEHDQAFDDLRDCSRILEVGCGEGEFVRRLRESGIDGAEGIEINVQAVQSAQRRGVPVRAMELEALSAECGQTYDAVCAFQVLEHVAHPCDFLAAATGLLRPGGKLILSVPNADSFLRYDPWHLLDLPPHHMTRWRAKTFESLPQFFDLDLASLRREPLARYHARPYLQIHVSRLLPIRPFPDLAARVIGPLLERQSWLRRRLVGHTLYACFTKRCAKNQ